VEKVTGKKTGLTPAVFIGMKSKRRIKRQNQDVHYLNENGMVACNPRDREAAHRADVEGIATNNPKAVTCKKCFAVMRKAVRRTGPSLK
jgi:hypothetical protein